MEIPFYYSFKEFEENYTDDLKKWIKTYPDATEKLFLEELQVHYGVFFNEWGLFDDSISCTRTVDDYPEYWNLSISQFKDFMQEKIINHLLGLGYSNHTEDGLNIPKDVDVMGFWEDCNRPTKENWAVINDFRHRYLKVFFWFEGFFDTLQFDSIKYKNFQFSVVRIAEWIDEKIKPIKETAKITNNSTLEIIEPYQEKERGNNIPYKIAMLDEIGVIKELNKKYTNTSDIIRILQFITGGNIDNIEQYYNSIYGNTNTAKLKVLNTHRAKAKEIYFK